LKKLSLIFISLVSTVIADKVVVETMACPELKIIQNSVQYTDDIMALNQYAIANNCKFLGSKDLIEAIDYDPASEKSIFIKILLRNTGDILYVKRQHILIEQPGKKNSFRF
jgi:hypothetical protein